MCLFVCHVFAYFALPLPSWRYIYNDEVSVCLSRFCMPKLLDCPPLLSAPTVRTCHLASPTIESLLWLLWMSMSWWWWLTLKYLYMLIRFGIVAVCRSVFHKTILSLRAERRRREARRETFTTPEMVTTRWSILGPPAVGRPGPSTVKYLD